MVKKCIYCSAEVATNSVVDMCESCMYKVWGEKMSKAIVEGMERERDLGNLDLGRVSEKSEEAVEINSPTEDTTIIIAEDDESQQQNYNGDSGEDEIVELIVDDIPKFD